jgi:hypothetical protein
MKDLEAFLSSPGWQFLKKFVELNIAECERLILESELDKKLVYSEEDLEKRMRLFMVKLRGLPEEELDLLKGADSNEDDDGDPYYKNRG